MRERAERWWVTFQLDIDRTDINTRRTVPTDAPTRGVDLGLNVAGMARNRRLARAVADAGFAEFVRQLEHKSDWYGSKVWPPTAGIRPARPAVTVAWSTPG